MMNARTVLPLLFSALLAAGADWPQFRGPDCDGLAAGGALTLPERPTWTADLPGRGVSSPIVIGQRVFLTASSGRQHDRLHVLAFDARSGKQLWQRTIWATGPTASHPKTCMAAPTPTSDGRHIVALFATNDLICLDLDGNVQWLRSLYGENPGASDGRGLASSPLIVNDTAIVQVENQNTSFAVGIDLRTGKNRWHKDRPRQMCWSSPIVLPGRTPAETLVLLQGSTRLSACEPTTGREVWGLDQDSDPIASSVVSAAHLLVPGEKGLTAFELRPGQQPTRLWQQPRLNPITASPIVLDKHVYVLRGSILVCGDLKTGKVLKQIRLHGPCGASPVAAGGVLYCISERGEMQVIQPNAQGGQVSQRIDLGETVLGTPAIADGALFVRSDKHLWRFGKAG